MSSTTSTRRSLPPHPASASTVPAAVRLGVLEGASRTVTSYRTSGSHRLPIPVLSSQFFYFPLGAILGGVEEKAPVRRRFGVPRPEQIASVLTAIENADQVSFLDSKRVLLPVAFSPTSSCSSYTHRRGFAVDCNGLVSVSAANLRRLYNFLSPLPPQIPF